MRFGTGGVGLMGTTEVSVDGVVPSTLVGIDAGGVFPFSTLEFGIQNVTAGAVLQSVAYSDGTLTALDADGANRAGGGNDVWAAYLASGPGVGVRTNVGGLGPFPAGALGDVSEDGYLVLIQDASGTGLASYDDTGDLKYQIQATLTGFSNIRARNGYFAYPADPGWWLRSLTTGAAALLAQRTTVTLTIPVVVNSKLYVVEYEPATGVSVRLASGSSGYVIPLTQANSFNIDAVYLSGTTIRVGMSSGAGEAPTELRVFDVNVANGAFQSGITSSGSLVFTVQPPLSNTSSLPTNGTTGGGAGTGGFFNGPYRHPLVRREDLKITEPWLKALNTVGKAATGPVDLSDNSQVTGILQPEHGGTGNTSGGGSGSGGITQLTGDVSAGPGTGSQAATLANTAVTPGTYTNATVTFDAKGRATSASSGSSSGDPYMPLTLGDEPPTFVTDGAGMLIMVPFTP